MDDYTALQVTLLLLGFFFAQVLVCHSYRSHLSALFQSINQFFSSPVQSIRAVRVFMTRPPPPPVTHIDVEMSVRRAVEEVLSPASQLRRMDRAVSFEDEDTDNNEPLTIIVIDPPNNSPMTATVASMSIAVLAQKVLNPVVKNWSNKAVSDLHVLYSIAVDLKDEAISVLAKAGITDPATLLQVTEAALTSLTQDFITKIDPFLDTTQQAYISSAAGLVLKEVMSVEEKIVQVIPVGAFSCLKSPKSQKQTVVTTPSTSLVYTAACSSPDVQSSAIITMPSTPTATITIPTPSVPTLTVPATLRLN